MKKSISALMSLCVALTAFTGCASGGSSVQRDEGFTPSMDRDAAAEITVGGNWSNFQALEAAAADWNEIYPNVSINYTKIDNYNAMLSTVVNGSTPPDIVTFDADGYYEKKDEIVSALEDLSQIDMDTGILDSGVVAGSSVEGKFCALSWGMLASGFVVNDTLLSEQGLSVPSTREEFDEVCSALAAKGIVPIQGCSEDFYKNIMNNDTKYRLISTESYDVAYKMLKDKENGYGKLFEEDFSRMLELVENGFVSSDINDSIGDIYELSIMHFFEGNTPFLCTGSETFSGMKKRESKSDAFSAEPFTYEFVSLPVNSDEPVLSVSYVQGLSVVSVAKNADWANEFMRFLCSEKELNKMAEVKGVPCITKSGTDDERFAHIDEIPESRQVAPALDDFTALVDENVAFTMSRIACGELTDAESAVAYFENRFSMMT